jgi:hypothetical protein
MIEISPATTNLEIDSLHTDHQEMIRLYAAAWLLNIAQDDDKRTFPVAELNRHYRLTHHPRNVYLASTFGLMRAQQIMEQVE